MEISMLQTILSDKSLFAMIMAPGMIFTLILMFVIYKSIKFFGKRYLDIQERQALSVEEIVKSITGLEYYLRDAKQREDAVELTLKKMNEDISFIKNRIEGKNEIK